MRTIRTKVYSFNELSKEVQDKVVANMWDTNVNYDWWHFTYQDAQDVGIQIYSFDLQNQTIDLKITTSCIDTAKDILTSHGETTGTYKAAAIFIRSQSFGIEHIEKKLEQIFIDRLHEQYFILLRDEYEWLTSDDAVREAVESKDLEFTINGQIF